MTPPSDRERLVEAENARLREELKRHEAWRVLVTAMSGENVQHAAVYDTSALARLILQRAEAAEASLSTLRARLREIEQEMRAVFCNEQGIVRKIHKWADQLAALTVETERTASSVQPAVADLTAAMDLAERLERDQYAQLKTALAEKITLLQLLQQSYEQWQTVLDRVQAYDARQAFSMDVLKDIGRIATAAIVRSAQSLHPESTERARFVPANNQTSD